MKKMRKLELSRDTVRQLTAIPLYGGVETSKITGVCIDASGICTRGCVETIPNLT